MTTPFDQTVIWHAIFHPGKTLWSRRYRHVSLAGYSNDTWLNLDLNHQGVIVSNIYHYDEVQDYLSYLLSHYTVLKFGPTHGKSRSFLRPMSCVGFVKHVLGVRSGALLPDGLARSLVRDYGSEVLNESQSPSRDAGAEAAAPSGGDGEPAVDTKPVARSD